MMTKNLARSIDSQVIDSVGVDSIPDIDESQVSEDSVFGDKTEFKIADILGGIVSFFLSGLGVERFDISFCDAVLRTRRNNPIWRRMQEMNPSENNRIIFWNELDFFSFFNFQPSTVASAKYQVITNHF
jgi:hypothetical protein